MIPFIVTVACLAVITLVYLVVQFNRFTPPVKGIPVLMYHRISPDGPDGLTVTPGVFRKQMEYLRNQNYKTITFRELQKMTEEGITIPVNSLIITFDDAYGDFEKHAFPLLREFGFTGTVFIPVGFMGKTNVWDHGNIPLMTGDQIRRLALTGPVEFGLHSFLHRNYNEMTLAEISEDLDRCEQSLNDCGIPFTKVLAYPYGGYPKRDPALKKEMFSLFRKKGLLFALRIGNKINRLPIQNPYEVCRIDIRGDESLQAFRTKVKKGRVRLFS